MIQRCLIVGLAVLLGGLVLPNWAMATPLIELAQPREQGAAASPNDISSESALTTLENGLVSLPTLSGSGEGYLGSGDITPTGFGISPQGEGTSQNWLRVRSHAGAAGEWPALTTFGTDLSLQDLRDETFVDAEQITVDEIARQFLRQERARGRSPLDVGLGGAVTSATRGADLGLNLVRNLLDHQMDRELALAALEDTIEIREYLLQLTAPDDIREYEVAPAKQSSPKAPESTTISSPELAQIKEENAGTTIATLKEFILEYMADIRILFFFGGSLMLILLFSSAVTRWGKA